MLGYAFMGKAHTNAYKKLPYMFYPPPAMPRLVAIAGRNEAAVKEAARRYGYENVYTDWREMLKDPDVQLFDNGGPNDVHAEPSIAAAEAGKHIICEKPLAARPPRRSRCSTPSRKAGVKHIVRLQLPLRPRDPAGPRADQAGQARARSTTSARVYLQEWILDPNFPTVWRLEKRRGRQRALSAISARTSSTWRASWSASRRRSAR